MTNRLVQAYRQAPWRKQAQWIALFFIALLFIGVVIYMYLSVRASAAIAGRDIQLLQAEKTNLHLLIADNNTSLAQILSVESMRREAEKMKFSLVEPGTVTYIPVPGYIPRTVANLAPKAGPDLVQTPILRSDYTQSLWDWLFGSFPNNNKQEGKVSP